MRTICRTVLTYAELNEEAKEKAVVLVREQNAQDDFLFQNILDCDCFFDPLSPQLEARGLPSSARLFDHVASKIYYSTDREWYLDCAEGLTVLDPELVLMYLGVSRREQHEHDIRFTLETPSYRYASTIMNITVDGEEYDDAQISTNLKDLLDTTVERFSSLIDDVLRRIQAEQEYLAGDEYAKQEAEEREFEFYVNEENEPVEIA